MITYDKWANSDPITDCTFLRSKGFPPHQVALEDARKEWTNDVSRNISRGKVCCNMHDSNYTGMVKVIKENFTH